MTKAFWILPFLSGIVLSAARADSPPRWIAVQGECHREVTPDRASVDLTVQHLEASVKLATEKTARVHAELRDRILRLKLADAELESVGYSVEEVREWEKNRSVSKGFRAQMSLRVSTSEIGRFGEVMVIASQLDLKDVGALRSFVSTSLRERERIGCLEGALKNARLKADRMAAAAGATVERVLSIAEEGATPPPPPMPQMAKMFGGGGAADAAMVAPVVDAGKSEIGVRVDVVYGLR